MKKLFAILTVLTAMFFMPKIADAAEGPCHVENMCDNYVVICDKFDEITWDEIYCSDFDDY